MRRETGDRRRKTEEEVRKKGRKEKKRKEKKRKGVQIAIGMEKERQYPGPSTQLCQP